TLVRGRGVSRYHQSVAIMNLEIAAIVADVERAVGADRQPVRAAAGCRYGLRLAVGFNARDAPRRHLDHKDRAIIHGDRAFGKSQTGRKFTQCHDRLPSIWGRLTETMEQARDLNQRSRVTKL